MEASDFKSMVDKAIGQNYNPYMEEKINRYINELISFTEQNKIEY